MSLRRSWEIARVLLKGKKGGGRLRVFPFVLAAANLLWCGSLDRFLKIDPEGVSVPLFLLGEAGVLLVLVFADFTQSGGRIVRSATIFPTTPVSRMLFMAWGALRRPEVMALLGSSALFLAVFFAPRWPAMGLAVLLFGLMALNIVTAAAVILLWLQRSSRPTMGAATMAALVLGGALLSLLLFHHSVMLRSLPIVSAAATGLAALNTAYPFDALPSLFVLGASMVFWYVVGRRVA